MTPTRKPLEVARSRPAAVSVRAVTGQVTGQCDARSTENDTTLPAGEPRLFNLTDEELLTHVGPSWQAMTPREQERYGPPPPEVRVDEPRWARIRGGVLAAALWQLDTVAIARQVREQAPHLMPLLRRMLTIPAEWTDSPFDEDEFVSMLADLENLSTIVRRPKETPAQRAPARAAATLPASDVSRQPFPHAITRKGVMRLVGT